MKHLKVAFTVLIAACGGSSSDRGGVDAPAPDGASDGVDARAPDGVDATAPDSIISTDMRYPDADGDGFGDTAKGVPIANAPATYIARGGDCDDRRAAIHPDAAEICDHFDNNCNGAVDMADSAIDLATTHDYYLDADHDGFGAGAATRACDPPPDSVTQANDCADNDASSHPGGVEVCDGVDNDCDGGRDGSVAAPDRCGALVGRYTGTYTHHTDERIGSTIINQVDCNGTGSMTLQLGRNPALLGSFTCLYSGSLGGFSRNQSVTLTANVDLSGQVTGTIAHTFGDFGIRTFTVRGTQTSSNIALAGTGSWFPNTMSAVPWSVTFSFSATR